MNFSLPGNMRYQPEALEAIFGYDNLLKTVVEVEIAALDVLYEIGKIPEEDYNELTPLKRNSLIFDIRTTDVDEIERTVTKHDIRALVKRMQDILGPKLGRWVHIPYTSYDPLETGRALQYIRTHKTILYPTIKQIAKILIDLIDKYLYTLQIGRTHGQHALPITVGFWLATILDRVLTNTQEMDRHISEMKGKISGAVGTSAAHYAFDLSDHYKREENFQNRVLEKLGLSPVSISTQKLPPENLSYYLWSCVMLSGTFAQFGRDGRNLTRSEIDEIREPFNDTQVGSSTMAHKRNPIGFEKLEGMFIKSLGEFNKVGMTLVSEHQRDLVGSSIARDFPIIIVNLVEQLDTLLKSTNSEELPWLARMFVHQEALMKNFMMNKHVILAEPLYIALQMAGYEGDAHTLVSQTLTPLAKEKGIFLIDAALEYTKREPELKEIIDKIPHKIQVLLRHPEAYTGDAANRSIETMRRAREYFEIEKKWRKVIEPENALPFN